LIWASTHSFIWSGIEMVSRLIKRPLAKILI
jgi:hypothetical protein